MNFPDQQPVPRPTLAPLHGADPDAEAAIPFTGAHALRVPALLSEIVTTHVEQAPDAAALAEAPAKSRRAVQGRDAGHWAEAETSAQLCRQFLDLKKSGYSLNQAARAVGRSPSYFSGDDSVLARYQRGGVAGLLPRRGETGAKPQFEVPDWFIPAAKFFYLLTNRNRDCGSVPEAIRRTISLPALPPHWDYKVKSRLIKALQCGTLEALPVCSEQLRRSILARELSGKTLLPQRLMREIAAPAAVVRQYRHPKNAALDFLNSPGSMMWITDPDGSRRFIRAGDILEADDGTINFPCCVPWSIGGCPVSDKYGVKVGRFQFLRAIDAATRFRPGYIYVMRPRGSYRQEDILSLIDGLSAAHGKWRELRFERGSWKGNRVQEVARLMGIHLRTVYSPHSKPFIEGGFNQDWTKLSPFFPGCDIGRFMGETDEANKLLTRCQAATEDPKKHFPMLANVLDAFRTITDEENSTPVNSENYGRWVPQERWQTQLAANPMERLDPSTRWMFAPWVREWTVTGMQVGGKVRLFEQLSVPFDFSASFLPQFHGAKVRCYFNPFEAKCFATIVLASNHGRHRAGEVLGIAQQINEVAGYARLVMGWGDDPATAGLKARQQAAAALRRELRVIMPSSTIHHPSSVSGTSELRDGIATVATAEISGQPPSDGQPVASHECNSRGDYSALSAPAPGASATNRGGAILTSRPTEAELVERERRVDAILKDNPLDYV